MAPSSSTDSFFLADFQTIKPRASERAHMLLLDDAATTSFLSLARSVKVCDSNGTFIQILAFAAAAACRSVCHSFFAPFPPDYYHHRTFSAFSRSIRKSPFSKSALAAKGCRVQWNSLPVTPFAPSPNQPGEQLDCCDPVTTGHIPVDRGIAAGFPYPGYPIRLSVTLPPDRRADPPFTIFYRLHKYVEREGDRGAISYILDILPMSTIGGVSICDGSGDGEGHMM